MDVLGNVIISLGTIFMFFGVIGLFKFKDFYTRILVSAKIDTVGLVTIIIGLVVKHGFSFFSFKLILILAILMIINPLATHTIARSAYLAKMKKEKEGGGV